MVKRKVSKGRYIIAGIITALIFFLGITLGLVTENYRVTQITQENKEQEINYNSLQLQYLYLSTITNRTDACPILRTALEDSITDLSSSLEALSLYESQARLNEADFKRLERKYLQDNLRYWIFSSQVKEKCDDNVINILYFFSRENCDLCPNQGKILTYFKRKFEDKLLVFPINTDIEDEKLIRILRIQYNITSLPALVVNDDAHIGVISREELAQIICSESRNKEHCLI